MTVINLGFLAWRSTRLRQIKYLPQYRKRWCNMPKLAEKLRKICNIFEKFFKCLAIACMVIIIISTTYGVFVRYVLSNPQGWTEEISLLMLVWYALFASVCATFNRKHVFADFLYARFPGRIKIFIRAFTALFAIAFMFVFAYSAYKVIPSVREFTSVLHLSRKLYYYPIFVCAPFIIFHYIVDLLELRSAKGVDDGEMARN